MGLEHLHHFGLAEDPFRSDASEKFDVELPSQQDALARLDRGVRQGRGLLLLVGGAGAGKTRVARRLYDGLEEEQFEAAMMVVLRRGVGAEWLLPRIARQLGVERADLDREAVIRQIYERLAIIHEDGRRAVLI
ncbi:MAG: AAA family ATPase, partial [Myxococcota bacterium]